MANDYTGSFGVSDVHNRHVYDSVSAIETSLKLNRILTALYASVVYPSNCLCVYLACLRVYVFVNVSHT